MSDAWCLNQVVCCAAVRCAPPSPNPTGRLACHLWPTLPATNTLHFLPCVLNLFRLSAWPASGLLGWRRRPRWSTTSMMKILPTSSNFLSAQTESLLRISRMFSTDQTTNSSSRWSTVKHLISYCNCSPWTMTLEWWRKRLWRKTALSPVLTAGLYHGLCLQVWNQKLSPEYCRTSGQAWAFFNLSYFSVNLTVAIPRRRLCAQWCRHWFTVRSIRCSLVTPSW